MSSENPLPKELIELERSLAGLEPAPSRINRDRLMFAAGAACGLERVSAKQEHGTSHATRVLTTLQQSLQNRPPRRTIYRIPAWPIATAASVLVACLFAALYAIESNRGPVTLREVVYVDRPVSPPNSALASQHNHPDSEITTDDSELNTQYSVLLQPIFPFGRLKAQLPSYLALRQLAITQGIDALPQREYTGPTNPQSSPNTSFELLKEFLPSRSAESENSKSPLLPEPIYLKLGDTI